MSLALTVEKLAAGWGDTKVLHEVSFTIPAGGSLALLGRNGVGKSTLLHAIMQNLDPEFWDWVIAANLGSIFRTIRAVTPALKKQNGGRII